MVKTKEKYSMIDGKIFPSIFIFALPLFGSSIVQQLYNTVDTIFAGNYLGKEGAAAVGAGSIIFTCLIGFFTGIAVGVNVLVSQAIGRKQEEKGVDYAYASLSFGLVSSIVLLILGQLTVEPVLRMLNTPQELMQGAISYTRIYFFNMIALVIYNVGSGILRSYGNSKFPFFILLIGGLLNLVLNYISVRLNMGISGIAWATVISQAVVAIGMLIGLKIERCNISLKTRGLYLPADKIKDILQVGLPAGIQSMAITLSNIFVQLSINSFGTDSVAAFTSYFKIETMVYLPIIAFGQALTTFVGVNYGAGNKDRIKKGTLMTMFMGIGVGMAIAIGFLSIKEQVFRWFVDDAQVIANGVKILSITFPMYWIYGIFEITCGEIRGKGHTKEIMIITLLVVCLGRIIFLKIIPNIIPGIEGIALVYPVSLAVSAISVVLYDMRATRLLKIKKYKQLEYEQ